MNRLKKTQINISSSFYRNVYLLTKIVPPSSDFQLHFKKDMFDKLNMTGFLHVSHYLATVYDAKLFKRMVRWPILFKRDETTYRIEMKNFLCLLSQDNPDLNFPLILTSHFQSAGIRFQIIMWKLSQLALRAYIKRELQEELLNAPCTSPVRDLMMMYFNNTIVQKHSIIAETHKETKKILDAANNFLNDEIKILNTYKSEIFDRKENIKELVLNLPAQLLNKKRLMNIEDSRIIDLWEKNIFKKVHYIWKRNKELDELEESFDSLCKLVLRIRSNSRTLDANKFPKIYDNLLYTRFETQHLTRNLYAKDSIVFSGLLSLVYLMFTQIYHKSLADLPDLSQCLPFVKNACKKIKSLRTLFIVLIKRINSVHRNKQCAMSREIKDAYVDFNASDISALRYILLQSSKISFNFDQHTDSHLFYERLCFSPMRGKYNHLFKRYKREYRPLRELPAVLVDFTDTWNNMSGWLSPRAHSVKCEQILIKGKPLSPLYSRLLLSSKRSKEHTSRSPSANYEGLNLTPRKRPLKTKYLAINSYDCRRRDFF